MCGLWQETREERVFSAMDEHMRGRWLGADLAGEQVPRYG
jgi:hypothetical protein